MIMINHYYDYYYISLFLDSIGFQMFILFDPWFASNYLSWNLFLYIEFSNVINYYCLLVFINFNIMKVFYLFEHLI